MSPLESSTVIAEIKVVLEVRRSWRISQSLAKVSVHAGADLAFFQGGGGVWPNDDAEHRPRAA